MNRMKRKGVIVAAIAALASSVALGAVAATTDDSAALLKQARQPFPTSYKGPTVPASAPKQVKLALITCFSILRGCYSPTIGATHAAKALGWKVTTAQDPLNLPAYEGITELKYAQVPRGVEVLPGLGAATSGSGS